MTASQKQSGSRSTRPGGTRGSGSWTRGGIRLLNSVTRRRSGREGLGPTSPAACGCGCALSRRHPGSAGLSSRHVSLGGPSPVSAVLESQPRLRGPDLEHHGQRGPSRFILPDAAAAVAAPAPGRATAGRRAHLRAAGQRQAVFPRRGGAGREVLSGLPGAAVAASPYPGTSAPPAGEANKINHQRLRGSGLTPERLMSRKETFVSSRVTPTPHPKWPRVVGELGRLQVRAEDGEARRQPVSCRIDQNDLPRYSMNPSIN